MPPSRRRGRAGAPPAPAPATTSSTSSARDDDRSATEPERRSPHRDAERTPRSRPSSPPGCEPGDVVLASRRARRRQDDLRPRRRAGARRRPGRSPRRPSRSGSATTAPVPVSHLDLYRLAGSGSTTRSRPCSTTTWRRTRSPSSSGPGSAADVMPSRRRPVEIDPRGRRRPADHDREAPVILGFDTATAGHDGRRRRRRRARWPSVPSGPGPTAARRPAGSCSG